MVEGTSAGADPLAAARARLGIAVNVAAALAVARNSRRVIGEVFMTGQYNGNGLQWNADFRLVKRFN